MILVLIITLFIYFIFIYSIDNSTNNMYSFRDNYKSDGSRMSIFTPSPQQGFNNYNIRTPGINDSFNHTPSTIIITSIRPSDSFHNTDNYVTSADCSSITDRHKGNVSALHAIPINCSW